jgi:hypothetical protein
MGTIRELFQSPKMRESQQLFFGLQLMRSRIFEEFQHPQSKQTMPQLFGRFFHQIKVQKKRFCTSRLLKNEEIGGIFVFSG